MTRKDYILVAKSFYKIIPNNDDEERGFLMAVSALCRVFKDDSERFDEDRFLNACGIERGKDGLLRLVPF